jgi:hypothetical protein
MDKFSGTMLSSHSQELKNNNSMLRFKIRVAVNTLGGRQVITVMLRECILKVSLSFKNKKFLLKVFR